MSVWFSHPSRLQDNMMPMSPDDYKALEQYVSPRDIDAVVSQHCLNYKFGISRAVVKVVKYNANQK